MSQCWDERSGTAPMYAASHSSTTHVRPAKSELVVSRDCHVSRILTKLSYSCLYIMHGAYLNAESRTRRKTENAILADVIYCGDAVCSCRCDELTRSSDSVGILCEDVHTSFASCVKYVSKHTKHNVTDTRLDRRDGPGPGPRRVALSLRVSH